MTVPEERPAAVLQHPDFASIAQKYEEEKAKRVHGEASKQYIDLEVDAAAQKSQRLTHLIDDPWVDHAALNARPAPLADGDHVRFLLLGAGFCSLQHAVRLIENGFSADEMRLIDTAGGIGGTWYWNRYPGLQCDSEASIYLPLLEETGYMPSKRYTSGNEIRLHAERIAEKWNLADKCQLRTKIESLVWDEQGHRWTAKLRTDRGPGEEAVDLTVTAQFVILAGGLLNHPKVPNIDGLEEFQGQMLHTARWKYDITGGTPEAPVCDKLKGKRVGFIGTGATGVQAVAALAGQAGELFVFQRTPSSVDERGQRVMTEEEWAKVTAKPGWWKARNANFHGMIAGEQHEEDLVNDGWSKLRTYHVLTGNVNNTAPLAMEDIPTHIGKLLVADLPRSEKVRARVDDIVKDNATAENLKAWYPTWCKRPTFHDEYLASFNQDNVTLVSTDGRSVDRATAKGLVVGGKEYELDVIVFGTGYRSPSRDISEPAARANTTVTGRGGLTLRTKWLEMAPTTLHGVFTKGFPNLILTGPTQTGVAASITYLYDILARHTAHTLAAAVNRAPDAAARDKITVEPTAEGEGAWTGRIVAGAAWGAPIAVCTPSYLTDEGAAMKPEMAPKMAVAGLWSQGINSYAKVLEEWRGQGGLEGLEVKSG